MIRFIATALIFIATTAQASDVEIQSVATSDDIYACNLSINSLPSAEVPGSVLGAVMYENLAASANSPNRMNSVGLMLNNTDSRLFAASAQWQYRIKDLSLAFSTENMGVGYSVHICLLGPLRSNQGNGQDRSEKIYTLASSAYHSSGVYAATANLYFRVSMQCDLRNLGSQRNARGNNETRPSSLEVDYSYLSNWAPFNGSLREAIVQVNKRTNQVPRFCEIVFQFKEASSDPRPTIQMATEFNLGVDLY